MDQHIPIEPPPPYHFHNNTNILGGQVDIIQNQPRSFVEVEDMFGEVQFLPASTTGPVCQGLIEQEQIRELDQLDQLIFTPNGRVDAPMISLRVQDENGRNIYNVQGRVNPYQRNLLNYTVCDVNGREVLKIEQEGLCITVSMRGREIGSINVEDSCSTTFRASTTSGGSNFLVEGNDKCTLGWFPFRATPYFRIIDEDEEIGVMERLSKSPNGDNCMIRFPQELDFNSKTLLVAFGIMIYVAYFGRAGCGSIGLRGNTCAWLFSCLVLSILFPILLLSILLPFVV